MAALYLKNRKDKTMIQKTINNLAVLGMKTVITLAIIIIMIRFTAFLLHLVGYPHDIADKYLLTFVYIATAIGIPTFILLAFTDKHPSEI